MILDEIRGRDIKSTTVGSGSEETTATAAAAGTAAVETASAIPVAVQVRAEERGRRRRPSGGLDGGGPERGGGEAAEVGLAVQPRAKQVSLQIHFVFIFRKVD